MREPKKKVKATRVKNGGIHVYINKEVLELALGFTKIPKDAKNLEIQAYPGKGTSGKAMVMIRIGQYQVEAPLEVAEPEPIIEGAD